MRAEDRFWVKGQPYSIRDMLAGDPSTEEFVGGTVYQAYLSAYNYHRWRSPVSGVVRRAFNVAGTYFSEADPEGEDPVGPNNSQAYIAHVAARAVILIEAGDPTIGLVAVVPVGMGEISSCRIAPTIKPKAWLRKGDELGFFQYGGSTCCLVFRPGAVAAFALGAVPEPETPEPPLVLVNSFLASSKPALDRQATESIASPRISTTRSTIASVATSGGESAIVSPVARTRAPAPSARTKVSYPRAPGAPSRGARSTAAISPRLRMSVTFRRPWSAWMRASSTGASRAARPKRSSRR